jgi:hypothetical protein
MPKRHREHQLETESRNAFQYKAERNAQEMDAIFVDARLTPFFQCQCGQILDFAPDASLAVQLVNFSG